MANKENFKLIIITLLISLVGLGTTACSNQSMPTGSAAPQKSTMSKNSLISQKYSKLNYLTNKMNTGSIDNFKQNLKSAFSETEKIIPQLLPKGVKPSSFTEDNIAVIRKTVTKIDSAKTPEQLIEDEKEGINAIILALKDINNAYEAKLIDLDNNLNDIQKIEKDMNNKNYKHHSMIAFKKMSETMQRMDKYFSSHRMLKVK